MVWKSGASSVQVRTGWDWVLLALTLALALLEWPTVLVCSELKSSRDVEGISAKRKL